MELEKHCLFTLKGQEHKEEPDLTSWKRADLQPRDTIMKKKCDSKNEEVQPNMRKGIYCIFLIKKRTYAINSAGKGAA